jgi:thiosulfate/3-mercaptopyruvate sulfurtransferase
MKISYSPIIQSSELLEIYTNSNLIILDASNHKNALLNYQQKHLDGAFFIDLNTQLADIKEDASIGGRHPLPSPKKFAETLTALGITPQSHVIVYDDNNASNAAARCWWMLIAIGHQKVQVLNGGFKSAQKNGLPINGNIVQIKLVDPYPASEWKLPLSDIKEVETVAQNKDYLVIDVRDKARYNGETEPIDLIAGHIPGAINVPFIENLNEEGLFLSPTELRLKYQNVINNKSTENIIVHCGSGVTACHTLLAMAYANIEIPKLYIGSWSEWSRNNKAIAIIK